MHEPVTSEKGLRVTDEQRAVGESPAMVILEGVLARRVGDEMVLLNLESEQYFGLNRVGAEIVTRLTERSWTEAVRSLEADYEVDADVLRQDIQDLVEALRSAGLIDHVGQGD